jgi:hypothetical protein
VSRSSERLIGWPCDTMQTSPTLSQRTIARRASAFHNASSAAGPARLFARVWAGVAAWRCRARGAASTCCAQPPVNSRPHHAAHNWPERPRSQGKSHGLGRATRTASCVGTVGVPPSPGRRRASGPAENADGETLWLATRRPPLSPKRAPPDLYRYRWVPLRTSGARNMRRVRPRRMQTARLVVRPARTFGEVLFQVIEIQPLN